MKDDLFKDRINQARDERGLALMIAVIIISIMVLFTADLILNSQVNLESTIGARDRIRAEYIAKSGLNIAEFLIGVDSAVDKVKAQMMNVPESDGVSDAWNMLNGIPFGGDSIELLAAMSEKFGLNRVQDEKIINSIRLLEGSFILDVTDESHKINLNYAAMGRGDEVGAMLISLLNCPAEKEFLTQKKLKPEEVFYRIKDWIDEDRNAESKSGFSDENDPYRRHNPPFTAKNAPFDTLSELKMIEGWDEEMHVVFSPYLTIYPIQTDAKQKPKMNLNTMPKPMLRCFFPKAELDCKQALDEKFRLQKEENADILSDPSGLTNVLQKVFCLNQNETTEKSQWFINKSSVFRIKVSGVIGQYIKNMETVIERADLSSAKSGSAKGPMLKLLYWKNH